MAHSGVLASAEVAQLGLEELFEPNENGHIHAIAVPLLNRQRQCVGALLLICRPDTVEDVVYKLKDSGIIKYENKLSDYLDRQGDIVLNTGDIQINKYASYPDIFAAIRKVVSRQTVTIRFTEGDEVSDVIDAFVENGIGTKEDFEQIINTYDFGYSYIPSAGT